MGMIQSARRISPRFAQRSAPEREEAFGALFDAQFDRVYAFVRFRTRDQATAEDIASEVFARAWFKLRDLGDPNAATAWLFTTARRLVIDHYRRRPSVPLEAIAQSGHPSSPPPESAAMAGERLAALARCLTDLSERERDVIGLRFIAELRNREIASLVRTSEGNVAKIIHRTLRKLRVSLADEGYTASDGLEGASE